MRILLIEDEPDLLRAVVRALRERGFAVDFACNGSEGLEKCREEDYDLILLDILLPGKSGWEVLVELRKERRTPVIMLTARDALADRVLGLNSGADDYVTKPFEFDELIARMYAVIRRSAGQPAPKIQLGEVTIDTAAKKVYRRDQEIPLTAREYALMEFLALHRGEVISRTRLYDHLLGDADGTMSNLMDVYVGNIRRKVGGELIVTRRGLGYVIE